MSKKTKAEKQLEKQKKKNEEKKRKASLKPKENKPAGRESKFKPKEDPHREFREGVDAVLSDGFMVFLSILMIPIILIPVFIPDLGSLPSGTAILQVLDICSLIIVLVFILEYFSKLYLAKDKWQHFKSPWHLLDLFIIVISVIWILGVIVYGVNSVGAPTRDILLLRLARIFQAVALTSKSATKKLREGERQGEGAEEKEEVLIRKVDADLAHVQELVTWPQLQAFFEEGTEQWIDLYNVSEKDFDRLSEICNIPVLHFQSRLMEEGFPRLDYLEDSALIFVLAGESLPPDEENKYFTIKRTGIMIVCANNKIISISREPTDLFETVLEAARKRSKGNPSIIVVLYEIFNYIIKRYRAIISDIELVLMHMERIVRPQDSSAFLERTFNFKKEVTQVSSNLRHLREVINLVSSKRVPLQGFDKSWDDAFNVLADEASFLNESSDNAKDSILSIIDLHLNRTSYETNKVMRVLAIITALAIIPAIITGLLGENLEDLGPSEFHAFLWQVIIIVGLGMLIVLYVFIKLGWLKS